MCVSVSIPVIHVFLIRSKPEGERLVNSVAGNHLASLKPTAMRWTYSSSPMTQGSAVAGRSTIPQRVRDFSPRGYYSLLTLFANPSLICPTVSQKCGAHSLSHGISLPSSETCSLCTNFRTMLLSAARLGMS